MRTIELRGGPLDGERHEIHPQATEFRRRIGGHIAAEHYVPGEGRPLRAGPTTRLVVYLPAEGDVFEYSETASEEGAQS